MSGNGAIRVTGNTLMLAEFEYVISRSLVSPITKHQFEKYCQFKFHEVKCLEVMETISQTVLFIDPYGKIPP
jgi:hypothetical protein